MRLEDKLESEDIVIQQQGFAELIASSYQILNILLTKLSDSKYTNSIIVNDHQVMTRQNLNKELPQFPDGTLTKLLIYLSKYNIVTVGKIMNINIYYLTPKQKDAFNKIRDGVIFFQESY